MKLTDYYALEQAIPKRLILENDLPTVAIAEAIYNKEFALARELVNSIRIDTSSSRELIYSVFKLSFNYGSHLVDKNYGSQYDPQLMELIVDNFCKAMEVQVTSQIQLEYLAKIEKAEEQSRQVKKDDDKEKFIRDFVSFQDPTLAKTKMISALHSSRLSTWGFTAECKIYGITEYELSAVLDSRTSDYCRMIDGYRFKVGDAETSILNILKSNPDDIKTLQPFPPQNKKGLEMLSKMSVSELTANNWHIPPFHPYCRTLLVRVGFNKNSKAITDINEISNTLLGGQETTTAENNIVIADKMPTKEDYGKYGLKVTPVEVKLLEDLKTTPATTLGAIAGTGNDFLNLGNLDSLHLSAEKKTETLNNVAQEILNIKVKKKFPSYESGGRTITPNYLASVNVGKDHLTIEKLEVKNIKKPLAFVKKYFKEIIALVIANKLSKLIYKAPKDTIPAFVAMGFIIDVDLSELRKHLLKRLKVLESLNTKLEIKDFDVFYTVINSDLIGNEGLKFLMQYPRKVGGISIGEYLLRGYAGAVTLNTGEQTSLDLLLKGLQ